MAWLLTLLISAIIQVFLVHNYTFQMANNAYYSLFKDKAYDNNNSYDVGFMGYGNYTPVRKPFRAVNAQSGAGGTGEVHTQSEGATATWRDDRAAVPMMPYFEPYIIAELESRWNMSEKVRLKVGTYDPNANPHIKPKFLRMAMGTEGGFGAFFGMIESLISMAGDFGGSLPEYTGGYDEDDLENAGDDYDDANDDLNENEPPTEEEIRREWAEANGDYNYDGYNDLCELTHGNNHPDCAYDPLPD